MIARELGNLEKKGLAALLALCLAVLIVPAAAFAAIESKNYEVEVDASAADASVTHMDAISTESNGVGVLAKAGHAGTATVGNVNAANALGIYAHADGDNASANVTAGAVAGTYTEKAVFATGANATVNATVDSVNATIARDGYSHNFGVHSDMGKNGTSNVTVNGDVTISGVAGYTTAVNSFTSDATATSTVTVAGDVNMTGGEYVLKAQNYGSGSGGMATLSAGNVTATDVSSGYSYGNGPAVVRTIAKEGTAAMTMGNLVALGTSYVGARVNSTYGGTLTFNAGNIAMEREGSYALDGSVNDAGSLGVVKVGDITSNKGHGVNLSANSGATLNLETGNITGTGYNYLSADGGEVTATLGTIASAQHDGLNVSSKNTAGSKYTVTTGSITSPEKALSFYTYASAEDPDTITVNGDVTSTGDSHDAGAIYGSSAHGCIDLTVNGNVTSKNSTITDGIQGSATITGDVSSTGADYIPAIASVAYRGPLDLFVGGTISSNGPALSNNAESYENLTLTTWKVTSGTGVYFQGDDEDGTFAKTVNYIVKVEQPKEGDVQTQPIVLSAVKEDGSPLDLSHDFEIAHEGEKVYLIAENLPACTTIAKAYNGEGENKVELSKDETGRFYYTVERGGGIYLSADLVEEHDWDEVSWRWDGDEQSGYTAAYALFHCKRDSQHDVQVKAELLDVMVPPTCIVGGCTRYTAAVTAEQSPDHAAHSDVQDAKLTDPLGHDWGEWTVTSPANCTKAGSEERVCKRDEAHVETRELPVDPAAHDWADWVVTVEPSPTSDGVRTRTCKNNATHVEKEAIAASGKLLVTMVPKGKKGLKLSYTSVEGASGYEVYFAPCNHKNKKNYCKKVATIASGKAGTWVKKGLKKGTSYKAFMMAYKLKDGTKTYMDTSLTAHAYTSGGSKSFTNAKKVTVKTKAISLGVGKSEKIKAGVKKAQKGKKLISTKHAAKLRYITSDKGVATVDKTGKVTGKRKGICKVYVIAANGARQVVTVKVS